MYYVSSTKAREVAETKGWDYFRALLRALVEGIQYGIRSVRLYAESTILSGYIDHSSLAALLLSGLSARYESSQFFLHQPWGRGLTSAFDRDNWAIRLPLHTRRHVVALERRYLLRNLRNARIDLAACETAA
jgi:hypothetical protein